MKPFLTALLLCLIASSANAKPTQVFDRHAIYSIGSEAVLTERAVRKVRTAAKRKHNRKHNRKHQRHKGDKLPSTAGHVVVASTGAKASVSTVARPNFQCLIGKLEAVGYRIDFMGGYASRGNSSAHPTGNALDINQTGRNIVTRPLPASATAMASECKLVHGAVWSNPDQGHFEMPAKYGYVFHRHRVRYAAR